MGVLQNQLERYKKLFHISEKLHSTMNADLLLGELFVILKEVYPNYSYILLLSHDTHCHNDLPIIEIDYDSDNFAVVTAYTTGINQFEYSSDEQHAILYAPLKGRQGIYGVLQIIVPDSITFPDEEIEFITLFTNCAGSALENARLYQQNHQVISNLKLLNDTSQRLNSNSRLAEKMSYVSDQIKASFEAEEVGFFLVSDDQTTVKILPGTTRYFFSKQARIYLDYIKKKFLLDPEPLFIGDVNLHKIVDFKNFHSVMAIPVFQNEILRGFSIVMHHKPYFFSFEAFKLLQSLIQHSSLALTNTLLREELSRLVITDHLTKLHSRKFLDEKIQQSMKEDDEGTFILVDLDNFKKVNDSFGHQIGDEVLVQVAILIKSGIRKNDIGARWGGEELAIYLPGVSLEKGVSIAERLVVMVNETSTPHVTVSCGVSYWHQDYPDTYQALFKRADEALYFAKETGKNKVVTQADYNKEAG
ncbi:sensor domain-containing diguanylate cyclase [Neobacillus sp. LXY-1]|uniref:sensor domain-containing diguanylate cyclase n=1 Tax=Neobacillus sp. LXY-1 TaxID=3379133 RepID=UPI003EE296FF